MKRQTFMATAIILLTIFSFMGCKKDTKRDYNSLVKNTVWTGEFKYTGAISQPFSVEFKEGGQLTWYELSGEYGGTWKIEDDMLNVTFSTGSGFKAGISDDNKLVNIQHFPINNWAVVNAALNTVTDESLDQTTWTAPNLILTFKAGNVVDMDFGAGSAIYTGVSYIRKAKSVHFNIQSGSYKWFIVLNSKQVFKGVKTFTSAPAIYPFDLTKK
jgi:hypothetical protein